MEGWHGMVRHPADRTGDALGIEPGAVDDDAGLERGRGAGGILHAQFDPVRAYGPAGHP